MIRVSQFSLNSKTFPLKQTREIIWQSLNEPTRKIQPATGMGIEFPDNIKPRKLLSLKKTPLPKNSIPISTDIEFRKLAEKSSKAFRALGGRSEVKSSIARNTNIVATKNTPNSNIKLDPIKSSMETDKKLTVSERIALLKAYNIPTDQFKLTIEQWKEIDNINDLYLSVKYSSNFWNNILNTYSNVKSKDGKLLLPVSLLLGIKGSCKSKEKITLKNIISLRRLNILLMKHFNYWPTLLPSTIPDICEINSSTELELTDGTFWSQLDISDMDLQRGDEFQYISITSAYKIRAALSSFVLYSCEQMLIIAIEEKRPTISKIALNLLECLVEYRILSKTTKRVLNFIDFQRLTIPEKFRLSHNIALIPTIKEFSSELDKLTIDVTRFLQDQFVTHGHEFISSLSILRLLPVSSNIEEILMDYPINRMSSTTWKLLEDSYKNLYHKNFEIDEESINSTSAIYWLPIRDQIIRDKLHRGLVKRTGNNELFFSEVENNQWRVSEEYQKEIFLKFTNKSMKIKKIKNKSNTVLNSWVGEKRIKEIILGQTKQNITELRSIKAWIPELQDCIRDDLRQEMKYLTTNNLDIAERISSLCNIELTLDNPIFNVVYFSKKGNLAIILDDDIFHGYQSNSAISQIL